MGGSTPGFDCIISADGFSYKDKGAAVPPPLSFVFLTSVGEKFPFSNFERSSICFPISG